MTYQSSAYGRPTRRPSHSYLTNYFSSSSLFSLLLGILPVSFYYSNFYRGLSPTYFLTFTNYVSTNKLIGCLASKR